MTTVLIHPSRGNKDGRVNLRISLEKEVDFSAPPISSTLTPGQRAELLERHPTGRARFWGTYDSNRSKIMRVREGDLVIFTGEGAGWAVGVVGYRFENPLFSETLWKETEGKG